MKNKKRFKSLDFMRGLGLILMVQIHIAMYLTLTTGKSSILYFFMNRISYLAAPLFLTAVGISLVISVNRRKEKALSHETKRVLFLILLGFLFINIWNADIIHYIGIYIILAFFLLRFKKLSRFIIANIFLWGAPVILLYINYMSGWEHLAYKLANFWTFQGFFTNLVANGFYPMFPWIFYIIIGSIVGEYLLESVKKKKEEIFCIIALIAGIILFIIGLLLDVFSPWRIGFYPATVSYIILYLGVSLFIFGLFFWLLDYSKKKSIAEVLRPVIFLGTVSLSIYVFHIIFGLGYFYFANRFNTLGLMVVIPYIISLLVILGLICYLSIRKLGYGPLEYLLRKLS